MSINGRTKHGTFHLRRLSNITEDALTHHACGTDKPVGDGATRARCHSHPIVLLKPLCCRTLWRGGAAFAGNHPSKPSPFIRHNLLHPLRGFVRCSSSTKGGTPIRSSGICLCNDVRRSVVCLRSDVGPVQERIHRHQLELLLAVSLIHNSSIERCVSYLS